VSIQFDGIWECPGGDACECLDGPCEGNAVVPAEFSATAFYLSEPMELKDCIVRFPDGTSVTAKARINGHDAMIVRQMLQDKETK
jgi:hypothetical protein